MTVDFTVKRIVLIEDDLYLVKNIKLLLEKNRFDVISGKNIKEGK